MPIPRDKFERGPPPDALVIEFLDGHTESAYTAEELEIELRMKGKPGAAPGDPMFGAEGHPDLKSLLETLGRAGKIQRKEMDGKVYYCSTKPVASAAPTPPGGTRDSSKAPAPSDTAR